MNILFLTTAHNSLSQRAFVELVDRGHRVTVVLASSEAVMLAAVERELPDLIVAPMLKQVIPASIWQHHTCLITETGWRRKGARTDRSSAADQHQNRTPDRVT